MAHGAARKDTRKIVCCYDGLAEWIPDNTGQHEGEADGADEG